MLLLTSVHSYPNGQMLDVNIKECQREIVALRFILGNWQTTFALDRDRGWDRRYVSKRCIQRKKSLGFLSFRTRPYFNKVPFFWYESMCDSPPPF